MKKKILKSLLLLLIGTNVFAQDSIPKTDGSKNLLYFYGGKIKYIDGLIRTREPWFKSSYFKLSSGEEIEFSKIQFYNDGSGFYGNTKTANQTNSFAQRILKGKVNYFEELIEVSSAPMMGANGMWMGGGSSTKIRRFYNRGYGPLKKANYDNLVEDLVDNQESMLLLANYKKIRDRKVLIYVISGIASVAGLLTAFEGTGEYEESYNFETNRNETTEKYNVKPLNLTIGIVGIITGFVNYYKSRRNSEKLEDAIYAYNK